MRNRFGDLEDWLVGVLISLAICASVVANIFPVPTAWEIPLIFVALLAIYRSCYFAKSASDTLQRVAPILSRIDASTITTSDTVGKLAGLAEGRAISTFRNASEFYASLTASLLTTSSSVDLTHIRGEVPNDFGVASNGWFSQVLDWARQDTYGRSVRRIISVQNCAMENWARQLQVELETLDCFYVGVVDWPLDIPAVNVAILDGTRLYLSLPGPTPQRSAGLVTEDRETLSHFREAYDVLFQRSQPLGSWLEARE